MNCRYCGTALPEGALFCGECGQPVSSVPGAASAVTAASSARPVPSTPWPEAAIPAMTVPGSTIEADVAQPAAGLSFTDLAFSSPGETSDHDHDHGDGGRELPDGTPLDPTPHQRAESAVRCPQCGEPMAEGDVFCGECGFVVRSVAPAGLTGADDDGFADVADEAAAEAPAESGSDPTAEIDPLLSTELDSVSVVEAEPELAGQPGPVPELAAEPEPSIDRMVRESVPAVATTPVETDPDLEFDEPLPLGPHPVTPGLPARSRPIPDPFPWGATSPLREDIEATRLIADPESATRYVLQFSTGESVTVAGSGLVGRNPSVQPGEYVDQLVPIFDAGKSVSKTHLEFGQESGRFWVSDRYSTNGSVIRQPDAEPRPCDPGRRYFIARGSRVDMGEQFFVVS